MKKPDSTPKVKQLKQDHKAGPVKLLYKQVKSSVNIKIWNETIESYETSIFVIELDGTDGIMKYHRKPYIRTAAGTPNGYPVGNVVESMDIRFYEFDWCLSENFTFPNVSIKFLSFRTYELSHTYWF